MLVCLWVCIALKGMNYILYTKVSFSHSYFFWILIGKWQPGLGHLLGANLVKIKKQNFTAEEALLLSSVSESACGCPTMDSGSPSQSFSFQLSW